MTIESKNIFSNRAVELLSQKKFAQQTATQPEYHWAIEYSGRSAQIQTDRILTLQYSNSTGQSLVDLFLESVCSMLVNRPLQALFSLSFREVENFLRDENHLPAFSNDSETAAREVFLQVKMTLVQKVLLENVDTKRLIGTDQSWNDLSLAGKNRTVINFFSWLNDRFGKTNSLELILVEDPVVTVKNNDFPLDLPLVEGLLNQLFTSKETLSPLKVIGTL